MISERESHPLIERMEGAVRRLAEDYLEVLGEMTGMGLEPSQGTEKIGENWDVPYDAFIQIRLSGTLHGWIGVSLDRGGLASALGMDADDQELIDLLKECLNSVSGETVRALGGDMGPIQVSSPTVESSGVSHVGALFLDHQRAVGDNAWHFCVCVDRNRYELESLRERFVEAEARMLKAVSEVREAEERAKKSYTAQSEFLAKVSHEIRTPMNGIIGCAELLKGTGLREEQLELVATIWDSGNALLGLINELLDFSKMEAGKLELETRPFDVMAVTKQVVKLCEVKAKESDVTLTARLPQTDLPLVLGDTVRVRQILLNLIGNAIKFTPGGRVEVSVASRSLGPDYTTFDFQVLDNGIGIAEDRLDAIFKKFEQADASTTRQFGGTGLGLAICRELIEMMDGQMTVESRLGRGSTFRFSITLAHAGAKDTEDTGLIPIPGSAFPKVGDGEVPPGVHVLLVEDNPVNQKVAKGMLAKFDAIVELAQNGQEAVDKARTRKWDIILMDIQMPIMDGYDAARGIRKDLDSPSCRSPIVALTANAASEQDGRCRACGMNGYLSKPFRLVELRNTIASVLASAANEEAERGVVDDAADILQLGEAPEALSDAANESGESKSDMKSTG